MIVDEVMANLGEPWRVMQTRLERLPIIPPRIAAITTALRRLGGPKPTKTARAARAMVLGQPALDAATRESRIAHAAAELGVTSDELEQLLWSDLAGERAVTLPNGRPDALLLVAIANETKLKRVVARAESIVLRVWGDARPIARAAATRGLIVTITQGALASGSGSDSDSGSGSGSAYAPLSSSPDRESDEITTFSVCGPLALVHNTVVYGRALASFVPYLGDCSRFEIDVRCNFGFGPTTSRLSSPIILRPAPVAKPWKLVSNLGLALERRRADVSYDPAPVVSNGALVFPDLCVDGTFVEVVSFWTEPFLAAKLAHYRDAGVSALICAAVLPDVDLPDGVVRFERHVMADDVLAAIDERSALASGVRPPARPGETSKLPEQEDGGWWHDDLDGWSIDDLDDQPVEKSVDRARRQPVSPSVEQSVGQTTQELSSQSAEESVDRSICRPVRELAGQSGTESVGPSARQAATQAVRDSVNESAGPSVRGLADRLTSFTPTRRIHQLSAESVRRLARQRVGASINDLDNQPVVGRLARQPVGESVGRPVCDVDAPSVDESVASSSREAATQPVRHSVMSANESVGRPVRDLDGPSDESVAPSAREAFHQSLMSVNGSANESGRVAATQRVGPPIEQSVDQAVHQPDVQPAGRPIRRPVSRTTSLFRSDALRGDGGDSGGSGEGGDRTGDDSDLHASATDELVGSRSESFERSLDDSDSQTDMTLMFDPIDTPEFVIEPFTRR